MEALIIPLKIDSDAALAELRKLAQQGAEAGKSVDEGLEGAKEQAKGLGSEISSLITHQGYQMLRDAASALAQGYRETADYIKGISGEYLRLQEILQQVAALTGQSNTGQFTVDQARLAQQAGVKPEEWVRFQEQFQSYAGAYLEGDQKKMGADQATEYQQRLASFAKASGIPIDQIAQLGGGILQFAPGEMTADQAMGELSKQFRTLERAPTPVPQLLPQMTRVMAQGSTGQDASQLLALASEFMPGEEQTAVENTLKALQQAILKGKGDQLGVSKQQSPIQRIQAAAQNLADREAKGEDIDPIIADMFPDLREQRGIRGFINRGVRAKGFERVAGYAADTPETMADERVAEFRQSDRGRMAQEEAALAAERVAAGERYKELARLKTEAEKQLTAEGRFEDMTGIGDTIRGALPGGLPGVKEQLINERAYQMARQQAGQDNAFTGIKGFGEEQATIDRMILDTLKSIERKTPDEATRPLAAPPPNPPTRP